ncbi:AraC family transcriptional regulator [Galbitalea soli]|uniref:AraC family transcriptional regulator n=1 Tax=Galbitalea soli TaxID=1268042 RepID=A0A7C9PLE8_9MICO|nr:AraC family transcriptional regulator [Galbitalea soli]NEM90165.1 AraC family transcriptional regulator [Galbitalea soli]NYJ30873.1 AraC-like DNA-binding protein/quercetin dioxygenase-like cupin family protein [Galbitalea soli]
MTIDFAGSTVGPPESAAVHEIIPFDPGCTGRWHQHDAPSIYARWNVHPEYEVHLVRGTAGSFVVGDHVGEFETGQLVLVGPGVPHVWIDHSPRPTRHRDTVLQLRPEWVDACGELIPGMTPLAALRPRAQAGIEYLGATAQRGRRALLRIGTATGTERAAHIFALLGILVEAPPADQRQFTIDGADAARTGDSRTELMTTILDDALMGELRLSAAARLAETSPAQLSRSFARAAGRTFTDAVRSAKLARACVLLEQTDLPIARIALEAGYTNLSNFNRQFRARIGCTPRAYRAQLNEQGPATARTIGETSAAEESTG